MNIIHFDSAFLLIAFIASLFAGGGIVFLTFTMIPSGIGKAMITAVVTVALALYGARWVGYEVVMFETFKQVQFASITSAFAAGLGIIITLVVFKPQKGEA